MVIKRKETQRQCILKDGEESAGKEHENGKVRLEKMETRKRTEILRKVDREKGEKLEFIICAIHPQEK